MKFVKYFSIFLALFALFIWLVTIYLGPDDLAKCGIEPDDSLVGCQKADAIVAVSGGDTESRVDEAIKLYKNGWAPILIFSGAAADKSGPSNAEVMRSRAVALGVEPSSIVIEDSSVNTSENAEKTTSVFRQKNIKSVILVSSAYHERRVGLEFERKTSDVELRRHPVGQDKQWSAFWWLSPTGWYLAMSELVASLVLTVGRLVR